MRKKGGSDQSDDGVLPASEVAPLLSSTLPDEPVGSAPADDAAVCAAGDDADASAAPLLDEGSIPGEDSRIGACRIVREEGNELFRQGQFEEASKKYERGLQFAGMMFKKETGEAETLGKPIRRDFHNNLALCFFRMRDFAECKTHCNVVLQELLYEDNVKALFRRGCAWFETAQFDEAEKDLRRVLELNPDHPGVPKIRALMSRSTRKANVTQKKAFSGMFNDERGASALYPEKANPGRDGKVPLDERIREMTGEEQSFRPTPNIVQQCWNDKWGRLIMIGVGLFMTVLVLFIWLLFSRSK